MVEPDEVDRPAREGTGEPFGSPIWPTIEGQRYMNLAALTAEFFSRCVSELSNSFITPVMKSRM